MPIDQAFITVQEDTTAVFVPLQNHTFVGRFIDALLHEIIHPHARAFGHGLDFAFLQLRRCTAAAVGTRKAIGLLLNIVRNNFQSPLDDGVALHVKPQTQILVALQFAEALDLDEVGNERTFTHTSIMKYS